MIGICWLGSSVICHRGLRVFSADPPFQCIRCSSRGFGCSTGRNVHAEETGGSGSVMMWLTSRPRAPTALGLLSGYPVVVPQPGDSVSRRGYRVQRSGRRSGSPCLAALFSILTKQCRATEFYMSRGRASAVSESPKGSRRPLRITRQYSTERVGFVSQGKRQPTSTRPPGAVSGDG